MDCYTRFERVWVLLLVITTVSAQDKVTAFTGEDVILPCSYSQASKPLGDITIFWRSKDDRNIYDILSTIPDLSNQDPQFKGRIRAFPEEYGKGNFSVLLENAKVSDTGRYDCVIPEVGVQRQVDLTVREKSTETTVESDAKAGGSGVSLRIQNLSLFLFLLLGQITLLL